MHNNTNDLTFNLHQKVNYKISAIQWKHKQ